MQEAVRINYLSHHDYCPPQRPDRQAQLHHPPLAVSSFCGGFPSYPPIFPVPSLPIRLMCAPFRDAMLEPEAEFYASGVSNE